MFDKTNQSSKVKVIIKSVSFRDRINATVFPLFGNSVLNKAIVKESNNSRNA